MTPSETITADDVRAIRNAAAALRDVNSKKYGAPGLAVHRSRAEKAEVVADKLEKRLSA